MKLTPNASGDAEKKHSNSVTDAATLRDLKAESSTTSHENVGAADDRSPKTDLAVPPDAIIRNWSDNQRESPVSAVPILPASAETEKVSIPDWFHEEEYLEANPDVHAAVLRNDEKSGYNHYILHGIKEGRPLNAAEKERPLASLDTQILAATVAVAGTVEVVTENIVSGWSQTERITTLGLFIDGQCRDTQAPWIERRDLNASDRNKGKGFKFHVPRLGLEPGHYTAEVRPILNDQIGSPFTGNGISNSAFDLNVPAPAIFVEPGTVEYLTKLFNSQPDIRRRLVADSILRYRPPEWRGQLIFVDAIPNGPSSKYRVKNLLSQLVSFGYDCCVLEDDELWRIIDGKYKAEIVHFCRAPFREEYEAAAIRARMDGARIGCDIDDLVFDPRVMPYIDGLRFLEQNELEEYRRGMQDYSNFIKYADFVTCTTEFLCNEIRKHNANARVVRNSLTRDQPILHADDPGVTIGYYAGTKTHQADFEVVAEPLCRVLSRHSAVRLRIVGDLVLDEFPVLRPRSSQITQVATMPYDAMLLDMAKCAITIAPLEVSNPFCEAKSELKYFEGALTGSAVIASPTNTFQSAISHGTTGLLARSPKDWEEALEALILDEKARTNLAAAAWRDVSDKYSAQSAARQLLVATGLLADSSAPHATGKRRNQKSLAGVALDIGFVIPELIIGAGGHRKILRICHDLEQAGSRVSLYILGSRSAAENRDLINDNYYQITGNVFRYNGSVGVHDALVATAWDTAYIVRKHKTNAARVLYFVQDFEPMFMPVGTNYLRALATYRFGFEIVCLGSWVAGRLKRELDVNAKIIPFPLDKSIYRPGPRVRRNTSVLAFARRNQERRAFNLLTDALTELHKRRSDLQIGLFGEQTYPALPFEYQNFGVLEPPRLAELYRNSTVGICFSPTNPSLVGYEMIACGTALIDLDLPDAIANFGGLDIPFLAEPTPEAIAAAILEAITDDDRRDRKTALGIDFGANMINDETMAEMFLEYYLQGINKLPADSGARRSSSASERSRSRSTPEFSAV